MKNFKNSQSGKFQQLPFWKIPKIFNLEKSKNKKFVKIEIFKIKKILNSENSKNVQSNFFFHCNFENSKNFQFRKLQKFSEFYNFEKHQIS